MWRKVFGNNFFFLEIWRLFFQKKVNITTEYSHFNFIFHIWAKFRIRKSPGFWLQNENQIYKSGKFTSFFPSLVAKTISFSNF